MLINSGLQNLFTRQSKGWKILCAIMRNEVHRCRLEEIIIITFFYINISLTVFDFVTQVGVK